MSVGETTRRCCLFGTGSAATDMRQASRDPGSTAPSVPKAPTWSDGEPSERISPARVKTRSAQSLPCKGEPEDCGRRRRRVSDPPAKDRDDFRRRRPKGDCEELEGVYP
jgi:hypothetical protein